MVIRTFCACLNEDADGKTKIRSVLVTTEHVEMWTRMLQSFLRPSETELFGLRQRDVTPKGHLSSETDPLHLELEIHGRTGLRFAATMQRTHVPETGCVCVHAGVHKPHDSSEHSPADLQSLLGCDRFEAGQGWE